MEICETAPSVPTRRVRVWRQRCPGTVRSAPCCGAGCQDTVAYSVSNPRRVVGLWLGRRGQRRRSDRLQWDGCTPHDNAGKSGTQCAATTVPKCSIVVRSAQSSIKPNPPILRGASFYVVGCEVSQVVLGMRVVVRVSGPTVGGMEGKDGWTHAFVAIRKLSDTTNSSLVPSLHLRSTETVLAPLILETAILHRRAAQALLFPLHCSVVYSCRGLANFPGCFLGPGTKVPSKGAKGTMTMVTVACPPIPYRWSPLHPFQV
jgi:hypothetical protein